MKFSDLLNSKESILVASLPENSVEYAKAAIENGADAIKLHVNLKHRVTGKVHETWTKVREVARAIKSELDCCTGIVPGAETMAGSGEIEDMEACGLSFFDVYIDYCPVYLLKSSMSKMLALNYTYTPSMVKGLAKLNADAIEISIIDPSDYGSSLRAMDLLRYSEIIEQTDLPCFLPTQKKISNSEIKTLVDLGFRGLIIGPIVTGSDLISFSKAVRSFSEVLKS